MAASLIFQATFSSTPSSRLLITASMKIPQVNGNHSVKVFNPNDQYSQSQKWSISLDHSSFKNGGVHDGSSKFSSLNDNMSCKENMEVELKSLKHLLSETAENDPLESLNMIDAVQRLGIDYYFREEIEAVLQMHYGMATSSSDSDRKSGLYEVALRFRLLRQYGYFVATDMFQIFMDKNGQLEKQVTEDIRGMISLYEASQFCLPEEDKLENFGNLSGHILNTWIRNLDHHQLNHHVSFTLANPFHTSLSNFLVKNYFGFGHHFLSTNKWIYALLPIAKMDFYRIQSIHQHEIFRLSQWWRETGLSKKLEFARDQPLKWYICSLAFLSDPQFSEERIDLTKSISFIYLIDDIYDIYGSLDELRLFTEAVRRWDLAAIENLPDSMKICFNALYEITNEISYKIHKKYGWNPIDSLKKSWAMLCDAFQVEAEWFGCGNFPSAEDYLKNGAISSGVHVVLAHIFFLVGQGISEETVQLLNSYPGIVSSSATILRLRDDLGSAKDENQEGFDGSYIEYYMKENEGISLEMTRQRTNDMISNAWKKLNKESLSPNPFPSTFIKASQNIARFVPLLYGYDENQNLPTLEKLIKSVLYENVQT